jgi:hypothetical protein
VIDWNSGVWQVNAETLVSRFLRKPLMTRFWSHHPLDWCRLLLYVISSRRTSRRWWLFDLIGFAELAGFEQGDWFLPAWLALRRHFLECWLTIGVRILRQLMVTAGRLEWDSLSAKEWWLYLPAEWVYWVLTTIVAVNGSVFLID